MMIDHRSRVDNARQRCDAVLHCITQHADFIHFTNRSVWPSGSNLERSQDSMHYLLLYNIYAYELVVCRDTFFFLYYIVEVVL